MYALRVLLGFVMDLQRPILPIVDRPIPLAQEIIWLSERQQAYYVE